MMSSFYVLFHWRPYRNLYIGLHHFETQQQKKKRIHLKKELFRRDDPLRIQKELALIKKRKKKSPLTHFLAVFCELKKVAESC